MKNTLIICAALFLNFSVVAANMKRPSDWQSEDEPSAKRNRMDSSSDSEDEGHDIENGDIFDAANDFDEEQLLAILGSIDVISFQDLVRKRPVDGSLMLQTLLKVDRPDLALVLIQRGAYVRDAEQMSDLVARAVALGESKVVKGFLQQNAEANTCDSEGTPLLLTAIYYPVYSPKIARLLFKNGASPFACNAEGENAITLAVDRSRTLDDMTNDQAQVLWRELAFDMATPLMIFNLVTYNSLPKELRATIICFALSN